MKKVIFFDLDNTLYSYDHCSEKADAAVQDFCVRQFGMDRKDASAGIKKAMDDIIEEMGPDAAAGHDRLIRFCRFLRDHSLPIFPYGRIMYDLYWDTLIGAMTPEKGIWNFLNTLKKEGWYTGCATNMTSLVQYRKIQKLGMESLFDDLITSEEALYEKPSPEFFRFCAARAGEDPEGCVYIGDNFRLDVLGAEKAGMKAIHYQTEDLASRHRKTEPGYPVIKDFSRTPECMETVERVLMKKG